MLYSKTDIDADAEREAKALSKQGFRENPNKNRLRSEIDYNKAEFDKLFHQIYRS